MTRPLRTRAALSLLAAGLAGLANALPLYPAHHSHACLAPNDGFPFCDTTLALEDRVADLISRLSLADKVAMTYDLTGEVPALGLPAFNWNQEGLHGLGAICLDLGAGQRCPTVFAAPPALASSFNLSLLESIGDAISTELRAYNNNGGNRDYQLRPVDLNVWLPNVNIARDARWGRQVETYSEDPFLTGQLGAAIVRGTQFGADGGASGGGFLKAIVAVKHATAYQVETNRFALVENISQHDLADTYYPAWQGVIADGHATGFMCSYPAVNGVPMCGNALFETTLMKESWGLGLRGGSYVQSDCGAIENIAKTYHYAANATYAAAIALNAGTDVDCGSAFPQELARAIAMGLTTESTLDASLTRTLTLHVLAGRFDPISAQPYMSIPFDAIGSPAHLALASESALQGMVLLRNDAGLLPLAAGGHLRLAVVGPFANSSAIAGNYFVDICPGARGTLDCVPTLCAALAPDAAAAACVPGVGVTSMDASGLAAAVAACAASDVCVLALGIDGSVCGEGTDRTTVALPGLQSNLTAAVLALAKPTVVVLFNGGILGIDAIVAAPGPLAIVEAFNPGVVGGAAVATALYGRANRWGKLPVSWPPLAYYGLLPIQEMDMVLGGSGAGRTYKYYNATRVAELTGGSGANLYELGFGLSYTNFTLTGDCPVHPPWRVRAAADAAAAPPLACTVTVRNTGARDGDEVVTVFVEPSAAAVARGRAARAAGAPRADPLASRLLVAFARVAVPAGGAATVPFNITLPSLAQVNDEGARVLFSGDHVVVFTRGHGADVRVAVRVDAGDAPLVVARAPPTW